MDRDEVRDEIKRELEESKEAIQIRVIKSVLSIAAAVILGSILDKSFEIYFGKKNRMVRITIQFITIAVVIALINTYSDKYRLPIDVVENIFFVSVFLGVQQNLFQDVSQLNVL